MDWLTFLAIFISIIPLQLTIISCLYWFRQKFDKYENITMSAVYKYIEKDPPPCGHRAGNHKEWREPRMTRARGRVIVGASMRVFSNMLADNCGDRLGGLISHLAENLGEYLENNIPYENPAVAAGLDFISFLQTSGCSKDIKK